MYLTRISSKHYHFWNGKNTACKMWLSGGMNKSKKWIFEDSVSNKQLCTMCANNLKKPLLPY